MAFIVSISSPSSLCVDEEPIPPTSTHVEERLRKRKYVLSLEVDPHSPLMHASGVLTRTTLDIIGIPVEIKLPRLTLTQKEIPSQAQVTPQQPAMTSQAQAQVTPQQPASSQP